MGDFLDLRDLIAFLDNDLTPQSEYSIFRAFRDLQNSIQEKEIPSAEMVAEDLAFSLRSHDHGHLSTWDLYFGPIATLAGENDQPLDIPPATAITPETVNYWRRRANETPHPIMRARYCDLL
jgi:hypothetical protein